VFGKEAGPLPDCEILLLVKAVRNRRRMSSAKGEKEAGSRKREGVAFF
jgi:hypothetical protein